MSHRSPNGLALRRRDRETHGVSEPEVVGEGIVIRSEDPGADDVVALLDAHLALMRSVTPAEFVFALDLDGLRVPEITFVTARSNGQLLGVGALKELDPGHGELKSMHTAAAARGRGVARTVLHHLLELARARGYHRICLETGSQEAFEPARSLYRSEGFVDSGPFTGYVANESSHFMTLDLGAPRPA